MIRRVALVALSLAAVLAPSAIAASGDGATLDGQRSTSHAYGRTLSGPTAYSGAIPTDGSFNGITPDPSWCTESTCDVTELQLRLPAGRQSGRLVVELTKVAPTASMHLIVYDRLGRELPGQSVCCSYRFLATRLPKGSYRVVVYDDAGAGRFDVEVSWKANAPHRTTPSG